MYGPLLLVIIAASVLATCSVILIVSKVLDSKYCEWVRSKPAEPNIMFYYGLDMNFIEERKKEYNEDRLKYEENLKEHEKAKPKLKGVPEYCFYALLATIILSIGLLFISGFITLGNYLGKNRELSEWEYKYEMVQLVEENGSKMENVALSQTKIEFNTWLSDAKASIDYYGNWSCYYFIRDEIFTLNYLT